MAGARLFRVKAVGLAALIAAACSASTRSGLKENVASGDAVGAGTGGAGGFSPVGAGGAASCALPCNATKGEVCVDGKCIPGCDAAAAAPSNLGCEFWAVDLPNERGLNDAAAAQWGVVLSNASDAPASVTIEQNAAPYGQAPAPMTLQKFDLAPHTLKAVAMPRAEVTGWTPQTADPPGPPMTWLSSAAFRITATVPLVAYQFNTFTNSYSNDASLLIPKNGLGKIYRAIGYPTANPIAVFPLAGIPDHSSITIVGVTAATHVTVTTPVATLGDGKGVAPLKAGQQAQVTLGPFDVFNLASDGLPGDMTGTIVSADQPVAVFTSLERAAAPYHTMPPKPPDFSQFCCTDHLEEQLFPAASLGKSFVVTRSPVRSDGGFKEADELRFLGVAEKATVKTNLPPPNDAFTLAPGQLVETWTDKDIVVEASAPIVVAQILLSAGYTTTYTGDPSLTVFPPVEQYRDRYLFLVPPSWTRNAFVLGAPKGTTFTLDGKPLAGCGAPADAGKLGAVAYESRVCEVKDGAHLVTGSKPFGLIVYGYGAVGSYAFVGGADVKPIYDPGAIK